jgi:hypothetical protein
MGRKGVSKRKPKTISGSVSGGAENSNVSSVMHAAESQPVKSLEGAKVTHSSDKKKASKKA